MNTYLVKLKGGQTTIQADGPQEAVADVVKKYWKCNVDIQAVSKGHPQANVVTELLAIDGRRPQKTSEQWYYIAKKAENFPVITICKTAGKEKAAVIVLDTKNNITIPTFLMQSVKVMQNGTYKDIYAEEVYTKYDIKLNTTEGIESFKVKYNEDYNNSNNTQVIVYGKDKSYELKKGFVVAYEEIEESLAKEKAIPKASDGKYYNVWWKKNADDTLIFKDGKCYEKPKPVQAQLCTKEFPTFLGNVQDRLKRVDKGWQYKVSWQSDPLFAEDNKGYWVKYGEGDFNYLNVNTESAASYMVLDANGNPIVNLVVYYNQMRHRV